MISGGLYRFLDQVQQLPPEPDEPEAEEELVPEDRSEPYRPQGRLREAHEYRGDELVVSGPAGTGKTRCNLQHVYETLLDYPGARAPLLRKTRESLTQSTLVTLERFVVPPWAPDQQRRARDRDHRIVDLSGGERIEATITARDLPGRFEPEVRMTRFGGLPRTPEI